MEPYKTFEYKGYTAEIIDDNQPGSPREWDNFGTMVCFHSRYNLGDACDYKNPDEFVYSLAIQYFNEDTVDNDFSHDLGATEFIDKYLDKLDRHIFILPLYLYDHSGLTMNTGGFSCPWDSGQVGWIYKEKSETRKEWEKKRISPGLRKQVLHWLEGEVENYDQYLRGEVYGYNITHGEEDLDSCWGFYGDPEEYMIPEIKSIIDSYVNQRAER